MELHSLTAVCAVICPNIFQPVACSCRSLLV